MTDNRQEEQTKGINHYQNLITKLLNELSVKQTDIGRVLSLPLTMEGDSIRLCLVPELIDRVAKAINLLGWSIEVSPLWEGRSLITMTPEVSTTLSKIVALGEAQATLDGSKLTFITPYHNNSIGKYLTGFRLINKETPFDIDSLNLIRSEREYVFTYEPISNEVMCEYLETLYGQLKTILNK